jgi:hypothetical protein
LQTRTYSNRSKTLENIWTMNGDSTSSPGFGKNLFLLLFYANLLPVFYWPSPCTWHCCQKT